MTVVPNFVPCVSVSLSRAHWECTISNVAEAIKSPSVYHPFTVAELHKIKTRLTEKA